MKRLAVNFIVICCLTSASCATMLKGTSEEITVVSDPSGADVIVNEVREGPTPVTFTVRSKQDLAVTVSKTGYQPEHLRDPVSFRSGYETWAFLAYVIPMIVDLSDGAAWGHDHLTLTAHLEPNVQTPAAAAAAELPQAAPTATNVQSIPVAIASPAATPGVVMAPPVSSTTPAEPISLTKQPAASMTPSVPLVRTPE